MLPLASPCLPGESTCERVYSWTGNEQLAELSDVVIGKPASLLGILLIGLVARWLLHRVVDRLVRRAEDGVLPDRLSKMSFMSPEATVLRNYLDWLVALPWAKRTDEVIDLPFDGNGYQFEVQEVARCLREGLKESPVMPLEESITIMETLDEIRGQWGLAYPGESS